MRFLWYYIKKEQIEIFSLVSKCKSSHTLAPNFILRSCSPVNCNKKWLGFAIKWGHIWKLKGENGIFLEIWPSLIGIAIIITDFPQIPKFQNIFFRVTTSQSDNLISKYSSAYCLLYCWASRSKWGKEHRQIDQTSAVWFNTWAMQSV